MYIGMLTHKGIRTESAAATFELDSSITSHQNVGMPVAMTGNYQVGLGADGQEIIGFLESFEDRLVEGSKTGAVSWHLCQEFPYAPAAPPSVGGRVAAVGDGTVKAAGAGVGYNTLVTAVDTENQTCAVTFR